MRVKTIWLWRNIAKVVALWVLTDVVLIALLLATRAPLMIGALAGCISGLFVACIAIEVWPVFDFTIAPSNNQVNRTEPEG